EGDPWAAYVPYWYDGGDLWLNGALLRRVPQSTPAWRARTYRPQLVMLPASLLRAGRNELALRAASPPDYPMHFARVSIGPQAELQPLYDRRLFWTRTVPQITVVVSMLSAVLMGFIWWRRRGEVMHGLFGLAAVLWSLHTLTFVIDGLPPGPWQWWRVVYYCATGGFVVVMAVLTLRFVGIRRPALERALGAYWLIGPLWFALQGFAAERWVARVWLGGMMVLGLMIIGVAVRYVRRRHTPTAVVSSLAVVLTVLVGIHDYLLTWNSTLLARILPVEWVGHRVHLLPLGSNTLLLAMGMLLVVRFIRTLGSLEELNRTLELRVADRERALADNYTRLAALEREQAASEERQLITRDLHDGLGSQLFTSLSRVERGDMDNAQIATALRGCIADMRLALDALASDGHDLGAALGNFMFRWEAQLLAAGVRPGWDIDLPDDAPGLSPHATLQVLRVAQEALTNVLKHAQATRVQVRMRRWGDLLELEIEDDGRGLDETARRHGHGLANMRARAQRLDGELELRPGLGANGTCVALRVPVGRTAP
ncbi:MAG: hypothetical protein JWQ03_2897, partial [Variovorax sp.]|nr:hypothetical protein [Variovorax sp.]